MLLLLILTFLTLFRIGAGSLWLCKVVECVDELAQIYPTYEMLLHHNLNLDAIVGEV